MRERRPRLHPRLTGRRGARSEAAAANQHDAIKAFVQGTIAEAAPVVPISAQLKYNIDAVCEYIVKKARAPTACDRVRALPLRRALRGPLPRRPRSACASAGPVMRCSTWGACSDRMWCGAASPLAGGRMPSP